MLFQVVLGGGRSKFFDSEIEDPAEPGSYGDRGDGRNLIQVGSDLQSQKVVTAYLSSRQLLPFNVAWQIYTF